MLCKRVHPGHGRWQGELPKSYYWDCVGIFCGGQLTSHCLAGVLCCTLMHMWLICWMLILFESYFRESVVLHLDSLHGNECHFTSMVLCLLWHRFKRCLEILLQDASSLVESDLLGGYLLSFSTVITVSIGFFKVEETLCFFSSIAISVYTL